jgi:sulfonate transport system substrate-binding protein
MKVAKTVLLSFVFGVVAAFGARSARADAPTEIRFSNPGVGIGNRPVAGGNAIGTAQLRGLLEEEFKPDGIKITWSFLRGAGPAVNELFANDLTDFAALGDLPSIVGRASGLGYRALLASSVRGNGYIAVPADSPIRDGKELRGKKVAVNKGTATHLVANKILETFGLTEKDVKLISMDTNTAKAAIVTGDIDAAVGSSDYLALRDQGAARILYTTRGADPKLTSNSLLVGSKSFITKYPEHTKRVIKVLVLTAKWLADQENKPEPLYQLWTRTGFSFGSYKEDWQGETIKYKLSPLLDPYVYARYTLQIAEAKRLGLVRNTFDFANFADPSFLNAVLGELGLQRYWLPRDAVTGEPPVNVIAAAAPPPGN